MTLLAIVLVAAPLAAHVPLAVLAGVLLFVAWNMGEWHAFGRLSAFSLEDRIKLFGTFLLTVMVDLTVAMEVGLAAACVVFVYRMSALFRVEPDALHPAAARGVVAYRLYGPLFFAAVAKLEALPDRAAAGDDDARPRCAPAGLDRCLRADRVRERAPRAGARRRAAGRRRPQRAAAGGDAALGPRRA